jgi:hypothetical protein
MVSLSCNTLSTRPDTGAVTALDDASAAEPQHPVGHSGDRRIMRDDHGRGAELLIDARDGGQHDLAGIIIECSGRLVAQQNIRRFDDGSGDGDALLFAAGKLRRKMIEPLGQPDQGQRRARVERLIGDFVHQRDVFEYREARNQIVELEHEADMLAPVARQFRVVGINEIVVAPHRLTGCGRIEAAEDVQQRRFAGAGGPQQHDEFALIDVEVDVAQRMHRDFAHDIDLRQAAGAEHHGLRGTRRLRHGGTRAVGSDHRQ